MNTKTLGRTILVLALAMSLSACGTRSTKNTATIAEAALRETVTTADPRGAVDAIYATITDNEIQELGARDLQDYYNITPSDLSEFVVYRSDATSGLCDIAIIKPASGKKDAIRELLYLYKDARIEEFRNYDILNAYTIAQDAVVFDQSDYVVLLMLPDNEAAQDILDEYLPQ